MVPAQPIAVPAERLPGLDLLRALMMLLGIVVHTGIPYASGGTSPGYWVAPQQSIGVTVLLLVIHHWRMPVFFFLAGLFGRRLLLRYGAADFLRHRARRILLPWLVSLAVITPVMPWVAEWNRSAERHAAPLHLWFLEYLLLFSMLMAALWRWDALRRLDQLGGWLWRRAGGLWLLVPTALTLPLFPYAVVPYPAEFLPWWQVVVTHGWFYAAGAMFDAVRPALPWRRLILLALIATGLNLWLTEQAVRGIDIPGWWLGCSASLEIWSTLGALTGWAMEYSRRPPAALRSLADASYWIYLVHFPLALVLPRLLSAVLPGIALPLAAAAGLTLAISWGTRSRRLV
ncbi:MAG: acyltransferase family protein [Acidobacteria bacterium]|nr:acyltransferase family protein [Acidobacteriota bacterium]